MLAMLYQLRRKACQDRDELMLFPRLPIDMELQFRGEIDVVLGDLATMIDTEVEKLHAEEEAV